MNTDIHLEGKIVSVNKQGRTLSVVSGESTTMVLCTGLSELPVNYYDNVLANVCVDDVFVGTVDKEGHLLEDPFVTTTVTEKDVVMWTAIRTVRYGGKLLVPIPTLEAICSHVVAQNRQGDLGEQISQLASEFSIGVRTTLAEMFLMDYKGSHPIYAEDVMRFFKLWSYKNDMRLIRLLGVTADQAATMYMTPYALYERLLKDPLSVHTIPPATALHIAKNIGITYNKDELRVGTFLRELAKATCAGGNMYVSCEKFFRRHKITEAQYQILMSKHTKMVTDEEGRSLYLKELYQIERAVAHRLAVFMREKYVPIEYAANPDDAHLKYDEQQEKAVRMALTSPMCVITGPAGTGKTTIVKKILYCLANAGIEVCCTSFTGQATDRIESSSGKECANMDSMITHRENYKFDYLIIDESSMINIDLLYRFLSAFPGPYRLLLIGDVKQLPPIGPGRVLEQIMISETIPVTVLSTIHRVASSLSKIVENSQRMASWGSERFEFKQGEEFELRNGDEESVVDEIYNMQKAGYTLDDFVIITPFKDQLANLGRVIQMAYNKGTKFVIQEPTRGWKVYPCLTKELLDEFDTYPEIRAFHVGDRVIVRGRVKEHNIYNGQEGVITDVGLFGVSVCITKRGEKKDVLFPLRTNKETSDTGESEYTCSVYMLELANALTVHRIQGGQRKRVVIWIDTYKKKSQEAFVCKEIIYTAVTRASDSVLIIHKGDAAERAVTNIVTDKKDSLSKTLLSILPREYMLERDTLMEKEVAARKEAVIAEYAKEFGHIDDADAADACDYDEDW